jgi:hypothetical protein
MLLALRPYASPDHALIDLPGPASQSGRRSDGLEGFARTFLLAAFRLAGAAGTDPLGIAEWYAAGIAAGTDPSSRWRWPRMDEADQAKVEAASIAIALHETRPWIWDRLDSGVRGRVLDWFAAITGAWVPDNNWVWFRAVVEAFSRNAGGSWASADIEHAIARTEDWYAGDGWYADGGYSDGRYSDGGYSGGGPRPGDYRNFDHYSGWAMQLYPLWFCRIAGPGSAEPGLASRYRERLRRYLADAEHLVGGDGAPLFQGRSLTYRFAALAPFWAGALFDATPLAPGLTRRIASGMLRYFLDAGCLRPDGTLSIGWHGEFWLIRQAYSGPGSPYWASKGFAGLLLPADDPVWVAVEEPLAVERGDFGRVMAPPGWVASGTAADGIVRISNHGSDHAGSNGAPEPDDPFYSRLAYATRTGPDRRGMTDSHVALIDRRGRPSHRRPLQRVRVGGRAGISRHQAHWPAEPAGKPAVTGPWLTIASILRGCWEVRAARIDPSPSPGDTDGQWLLRIGGWLVAAAEPPAARTDGGTGSVWRRDGLTSIVSALHGSMVAAVDRPAGGNAFGAHAAVPYLQSIQPVVPGEIYAAAIALTADPAGPGEKPRLAIETGARLRVRWPDGDLDEVDLGSDL